MRLPLFPLPVVLLPGARMPLHIFEPRYRAMLRDCEDGDRGFGLIYQPDETAGADLPRGTVGCRAVIDKVEPLADGRANIVVNGGERFALERIVEDDAPYAVGDVVPFADQDESVAQLTALALRLRELFLEAAAAARSLAENPAAPPALPDEPAELAFAAAASIELDVGERQRLLASPSASDRMRQIITVLQASLPSLRARMSAHRRAKTNGHGPLLA